MSNSINFGGDSFQNHCMNSNHVINIGKANNSSTNTTNTNNENCHNSTTNGPSSNHTTNHYYNNNQPQDIGAAQIQQDHALSTHSGPGYTQEGKSESPSSQPGANGAGSSGASLDDKRSEQHNSNQSSLPLASSNNTDNTALQNYGILTLRQSNPSLSSHAPYQFLGGNGGFGFYVDDFTFYTNRIHFIYQKHNIMHKIPWILQRMEDNKNDKAYLQKLYIRVCQKYHEPLF